MDRSSQDLIEVPPDRVLFSEHLLHKQDSKLKKLKVQLKQCSTTDGNKVFNLDIKGDNHKYHFQIDFTAQELCFMRFEEIQDNVKETSCLACLDRNFYPTVVYSRLLMLLYSDPENGDEARCIKIPFIQRGNIHASNSLRKLCDVIYGNIVGADELKHWLVYVTRCGDMHPGERVFLCLTRTALIIVLNYHILHFHPYFTSQISVNCSPENNTIEITVNDKNLLSENNATDNFSLFKTFSFKSAQCESIEKSFKNLIRKSLMYPQGPSAHFNIRHSELSASVVPGTTSDNVMIIPHQKMWHDNNNSGSTSGSNGWISSSKIDNVVMFHEPAPHKPEEMVFPHRTASSNGSIPGSGGYSAGAFVSHAEINKQVERPKDLTLHKRGAVGNVADATAKEAAPPRENADVIDGQYLKTNTKKSPTEQASPTQHVLAKDNYHSDPGRFSSHQSQTLVKTLASGSNFDQISPDELGFDNLSYFPPNHEETALSFFTPEEVGSLPPPPPCTSISQTFVEFPHRPAPKPPIETIDKINLPEPEDLLIPERQPYPGLLRSHSFQNLQQDEDRAVHLYVNIAQEMSSRNSVHDDFPYYRFYYNIGMIRIMYARMSKKLKRRDRLSKEMTSIDFNKLEDHERWYDRDFKIRSKDLKFCNLYNISSEESKFQYDYIKPDGDDDPYWTKNELCFTIQKILEEVPGNRHFFNDLQNELDVTSEQLMQIEVLLSLIPAENNWKVLAEYIGLSGSDITIIEHFCYTYRALAAHIVLTHWILRERYHMLQHGQPTSNPQCTWDNLVQFLDAHGRDDVTVILRSRNENQHVEESTHF